MRRMAAIKKAEMARIAALSPEPEAAPEPEPVPEPEAAPEPEWSMANTKAELIGAAEAAGIEVKPAWKKADILEALLAD